MKQNRLRLLASILSACLLLVLLAGCAAKRASAPSMATDSASPSDDNGNSYTAMMRPSTPEIAPESPREEIDSAAGESSPPSLNTESAGGGTTDPSQKIIYRADLRLETTEFDKAVAAVEQLVTSSGGFIEQSSVNGNTRYNPDGTTHVVDRYASYIIRVPSDQFEWALRQAGTIGNVTAQTRDAENITSQYIDQEARLSSLRTQEERLLSMLEKSEDVETLVSLESRLAEVRYELESIERQLRNWQMQVNYSTICLNLQEVEVYTPTAEVQRTFGQKLSDAFQGGMASFSRGMQSFAIGIVASLPVLILLAALAVVAVVVARRVIRKRSAKNSPPPQDPPNDKT